MADPLIAVHGVRYKTYLKAVLIESLQTIFAAHPDPLLSDAHVDVDFSFKEAHYPSVIIRFYERDIHNAGVGHVEWFETDISGQFHRYKHYLYAGDIEFAVYALSSYDRDLVSDTLVDILAMGELSTWSNELLRRLYYTDSTEDPITVDHMVTLNTDQIQGFGETQALAPWGPEDVMVYQTAYRVAVRGEIYSRQPVTQYGLVTDVQTFPYDPTDGEAVPDPDWRGPDKVQGTSDDQPDPAPWVAAQ